MCPALDGGSYGDNRAIADFCDAVHRRFFTRSLVLHEVDDPADLRLGRAPGVYPDQPDFNLELDAGITRSGSRHSSQDLVKHVRLHPAGQLEVGFDTGVEARPDISLLVRGNTQIEGSLVVGGSRIVPAAPSQLACAVGTAKGQGGSARASCDAGKIATGGGGACTSGELRTTRPVHTDGAPSGWEVACSRDGVHEAYVICCAK